MLHAELASQRGYAEVLLEFISFLRFFLVFDPVSTEIGSRI